MEKKLNINNSKKLIIGVTILFCAVILIIGSSLAYFTQSDSKELGNIVSSNDNDAYINYYEEKDMMFDNLIPMKGEDIETAVFNYGCVDKNGYNVCGVYIFSLENAYKEVQKINISMIPTANSFTNLKYMMVKINDLNNGDIEYITETPATFEKNNLNPIILLENQILFSNEIATYAIVFYIESMDYDQTLDDAGKSFGATIRVDSLTTGKYIVNSFGDSCWDIELIDGAIDEYKLTKFYGIKDDGSLKEECENIYVTKDENDYYSVKIPFSVSGYKVTTLGNNLFTSGSISDDLSFLSYNNYSKIKDVYIEEGITTIEDGTGKEGDVESKTTFLGVGLELGENTYLNVKLPSTLSYIGIGSFMYSKLNEIKIPSMVKEIQGYTFGLNAFLSKLDFFEDSNLITIGEYSFTGANISFLNIPDKVTSIGEHAFSNNKNLYSLIIPKSVTSIGAAAFYANKNLTSLEFEQGSKLKTIGANAFEFCNLTYTSPTDPLIIPASVEKIERGAFYSNSYFSESYLNNPNLKYIKYTGKYLNNFNTNWYDSSYADLITSD